MKYNNCPLYKLKSKKMLKYLLCINDNRLLKQDYVASLVEAYIDTRGKPRLIEPPKKELKIIQKRIKKFLSKIEVPNNVFSGIKGRSYADNAFFHTGEQLRNVFKIDLTAFFPSISRDTVYRFFLEDLCCSPDVASILTNLTTINLEVIQESNIETIYEFLNLKKVQCHNHLISGAPTSQILSYLVNHKMFDEMQQIADKNNVVMTIYVDDVVFSSINKISYNFRHSIYSIVKKYSYQISKNKVKRYTKGYPKLITGVIITNEGKPTIKNSMRNKIVIEHKYLRQNPDDMESRQRLKGLLLAARQIDKNAFPTIYKFAFND